MMSHCFDENLSQKIQALSPKSQIAEDPLQSSKPAQLLLAVMSNAHWGYWKPLRVVACEEQTR